MFLFIDIVILVSLFILKIEDVLFKTLISFNKHNDFTIDVFPIPFRPVIQIKFLLEKSKSNKLIKNKGDL